MVRGGDADVNENKETVRRFYEGFAEGRVVELRNYRDDLGLMEQLGARLRRRCRRPAGGQRPRCHVTESPSTRRDGRRGWDDEGPFEYAAATENGPIAVPCQRYVKDI